jgi:hypothetical protein
MIVTTGNAASAIAMRESILKGVPKMLWRESYELVLATIKGDVKTLSERRGRAVAAFAVYGVSAERVFARLDVKGIEDIGLDDLPELFAMFQSLKSGEATVEDYFPTTGTGGAAPTVANPLDDEPAPETKPAETEKPADQAKPKDEPKADAAKAPAEKKSKSAEPAVSPSAGATEKAGAVEPTASPAAHETREPAQGSTETAKEAASHHEPDEDELAEANSRGGVAYRKGLPKRAVPPDYRGEGKESLMEAWLAGYDVAKRADAAK